MIELFGLVCAIHFTQILGSAFPVVVFEQIEVRTRLVAYAAATRDRNEKARIPAAKIHRAEPPTALHCQGGGSALWGFAHILSTPHIHIPKTLY